MTENTVRLIVACIGLIGSLTGVFVGYFATIKKQSVENARHEQEQKDQFDRLFSELYEVKKRLDEHNHYAEKIGSIEKSIVSICKDIEYLRKDKDEK